MIDHIRLVRFDKIEKQFKQVTSAMTIRLTNFCVSGAWLLISR